MLFGEALSRLYLGSLPAAQRDRILSDVDRVFESVRAEVARGVEEAKWMQEATRAAAAEKIRKIRGDFVGSDIYFNQSLLQERYADVSLAFSYDISYVYLEFGDGVHTSNLLLV